MPKVESKVKAAGAGGAAGGVVAAFVVYLLDVLAYGGYEQGAEVPFPVVAFVGLVVSGALAYGAGWAARHTPRVTDVDGRHEADPDPIERPYYDDGL